MLVVFFILIILSLSQTIALNDIKSKVNDLDLVVYKIILANDNKQIIDTKSLDNLPEMLGNC